MRKDLVIHSRRLKMVNELLQLWRGTFCAFVSACYMCMYMYVRCSCATIVLQKQSRAKSRVHTCICFDNNIYDQQKTQIYVCTGLAARPSSHSTILGGRAKKEKERVYIVPIRSKLRHCYTFQSVYYSCTEHSRIHHL